MEDGAVQKRLRMKNNTRTYVDKPVYLRISVSTILFYGGEGRKKGGAEIYTADGVIVWEQKGGLHKKHSYNMIQQ